MAIFKIDTHEVDTYIDSLLDEINSITKRKIMTYKGKFGLILYFWNPILTIFECRHTKQVYCCPTEVIIKIKPIIHEHLTSKFIHSPFWLASLTFKFGIFGYKHKDILILKVATFDETISDSINKKHLVT